MASNTPPRLASRLRRGVRRRCVVCGAGAFDSWFTMKERCEACGFRFEREPGYWVGAVTINTAIVFATFLIVFGGLTLVTWPDVPWGLVLGVTFAANLVVPVALYPASKTIWQALELSWHPVERHEMQGADSS